MVAPEYTERTIKVEAMAQTDYDFGRKTDAERSMQSLFLQNLKLQGIEVLRGSQSLEHYQDTVFRSEMERLNGLTFTESEFRRLLTVLNVGMAQAFDYLRSGVSLTLDSGDTQSIKLYDSSAWDRNRYQVVEELTVKGVNERRLDTVLMMNGLPVMAGELKKTSSLGIDKAMADINAYTKEGVYRDGLLRYVQIYFISDGTNTKYFSTDLSAEAGSPYINSFYWSDAENVRIKRLMDRGREEGWTSSFFKPENIFDLIKYYTLKTAGRNQRIIALRPYQIHALESGIRRVNEWKSGYYWHATGSGKTLTSYMLARAVREQGIAHKVIMVLDRNDLADQTIEEYEKFGGESGGVSKGRDLVDRLLDPYDPFVMTTIQSLSRLLKSAGKRRKVASVLGKRTVIVVDECHRSTFGSMFQSIRKSFTDAIFLGFTGTPILAENKTADSRITSDLFGDPIHIYTTKEAIDDGNVLRFDEKIVRLNYAGDFADLTPEELDTRESTVMEWIAANFSKHTQQKNLNPATVGGRERVKNTDYEGGLTGLLTVPRIADAMSASDKLRPLFDAQGRTSAVVFSMATDEKDFDGGTGYLPRIFAHYDSQFKTNFSQMLKDDPTDAVDKYSSDVAMRVKTGELDLVIVAQMFLTGFDAPNLGVIYIDKFLRSHSLMQAISRVNRVHPSKKHKYAGILVFFSDRGDVKTELDDTLRLFSNGRSTEGVVNRKSFLEVRDEICQKVTELKALYGSASEIDRIQSIDELKEVAGLVSAIRAGAVRLSTYDDWEDSSEDWKHLGISEADLDEYYSEVKDAGRRIKVKLPKEELDAFEDFEIEISSSKEFLIDVAYINELLKNAIFAPKSERRKWITKIRRDLAISEDPEVIRNREALDGLVEEIDRDNSPINSNEELFRSFEAKKQKIRDQRFQKALGLLEITEEQLNWLLRLQSSRGATPGSEIDGILRAKRYSIMERKTLREDFGSILETLSDR
jgi:type I restriction enzyme R subunit